MINSIIKQSIDLRLKFSEPPKLTASTEVCMLCGMLCGIHRLEIPKARTTHGLVKRIIASLPKKDDENDKLIKLLLTCQKEEEPMTDELIELVRYGYDSCC